MLAGGIDLGVGSNFALTTFLSLGMFNALGWPVPIVIGLGVATGALVGLVNGLPVGYLRLRALLTTLVTLIIVRAIVDTLIPKYQVVISNPTQDSTA
jgi:ribose transport system permease protein